MKKLLQLTSLLALVFSTSCTTTQSGYSADREFPVEATPLELKIDYATEQATGSAKSIVVFGFLRLGDSEFAYGGGDAGGPLAGLPLIGGNSNSVENAAVFKVLSATKSNVLGFPMFTKRVTDYYLWKEEEVWVTGYPGKVSR